MVECTLTSSLTRRTSILVPLPDSPGSAELVESVRGHARHPPGPHGPYDTRWSARQRPGPCRRGSSASRPQKSARQLTYGIRA